MGEFIQFIGPEYRHVREITVKLADSFAQCLRRTAISVSTHNRKIRRLRKISSTMSDFVEETFQVTLLRRKPREEQEQLVRRLPFSREHEQKLLEVLDDPKHKVINKPEIKVIYYLGMFTGQRLKDCVLLKWDKVDLKRRRINVKQFKTGKEVVIPIADDLFAELNHASTWQTNDYVCLQDNVYNQCPIQSQYGGCIPEVLQGYEKLLNNMIKTIPQVAVSHLEITWPDGYDHAEANEVVGYCLSALRKSLQYQKIVSCYGWVREVAEGRLDGKPHFHIGFFTNAHELQSGFTIAQQLNTLFTSQLGLPVTSIYVRCICPNIDCQGGLNLNCPSAIKLRVNAPNAEAQRINILNWLSYHAKVETKGNAPSIREYAFSKVK